MERKIGNGLSVVFETDDMNPDNSRELAAQSFAYDGRYRVVAVSP